MVLSIHGASVDIHAGGADLAFPHHACETLHAEAATGVTPFARSWLHVGTVQVAGEKMAKSTGNLVLVDDLLGIHAPAAIRLLLLERPWSLAWDYRADDLDIAGARVEQIHAAAARPDRSQTAEEEVVRLLLTDLDVPAAVDTALEAGGRAARVLSQILVIG
jgi:cysteinyl-tRNA synthetase